MKTKPVDINFNHKRFWEKVDIYPGACWYWKFYKNKDGYGIFGLNGGSVAAHRVAYSLLNKEISCGFVIDHICRNRWCVNPDHLRQVEQVLNVFENSNGNAYLNKNKTHCKNGHEFSTENTYINYAKGKNRPFRVCKSCNPKAYKTNVGP